MGWPKGVKRKGYQNGTMATVRKSIEPEVVGPLSIVLKDQKRISFSPYDEVGRTGLNQTAGFLQEDFITDLRGQKGARVYREMVDNSADLGAFITIVKRMLQQVYWRHEPFSDQAKHVEQAEWLDGNLEDMEHSWPETLSEICTMLQYGYAPMEVTLKVRRGWSKDPRKRSKFDDGLIGWRKIALRAQETIFQWMYDEEERELLGVIQLPPPHYNRTEIPIDKLLNFRTDVERDNPEGRSMLRSAYQDYYFAKRLTALAAIGAERNLAGIPVMSIPAEYMSGSATVAEKAVYARARAIVENIRTDEQAGIVIPSQFDPETKQPLFKLELLSAGAGKGAIDVDAMIRRHQTNMLRAVLSDWMMLGTGDTGSWSLSSDRTDQFGVVLGGIMDLICGVMNRQAIPALARLNGWNLDELPTMMHGDVESPDLQKLGEYIAKMVGAGVIVADDELEAYSREVAHLPDKVDTDEDTGVDSRPRPGSLNTPGQDQPDPAADQTEQGAKPVDEPKPAETDKSVSKTPPWRVERRGKKWVVVGAENGKAYGTHDTEAGAQANMRALYANVPDAKTKEES